MSYLLRSVHIRKFRGIAPNTALQFSSGRVFLVGGMGTGKRTLLDLLHKLVHRDILGVVGADPYASLTWKLSLNPPCEGLTLELDLTSTPDSWGTSAVDLTCVVRDAYGVYCTFRLDPSGKLSGQRRHLPSGEDMFAHDVRHHVQHRPIEEALDMVLQWVGGFTRPLFGVPAKVPTMILSDDTFGQIIDPQGPCSLQAFPGQAPIAQRVPNALVKTLVEGCRQDTLPFNAHIAREMGASSIEFAPRLRQQSAHGARIWQGFNIFVRWSDGSCLRHEALSRGQRRLVAHYWAAGITPEMPYFAEDLASGLPPAQLSNIWQALDDPRRLRGRQSFHAVRNPLLLDVKSLPTINQVRGGIVLCTTSTEGQRSWSFRNPTLEEARRIRAQDANFSHALSLACNLDITL